MARARTWTAATSRGSWPSTRRPTRRWSRSPRKGSGERSPSSTSSPCASTATGGRSSTRRSCTPAASLRSPERLARAACARRGLVFGHVTVAIIAGVVVLAVGAAVLAARHAHPRIGSARIDTPDEHTTMGADGAVRSVQAADLTLPAEALDQIWSPHYLERLARTYWRFLSR